MEINKRTFSSLCMSALQQYPRKLQNIHLYMGICLFLLSFCLLVISSHSHSPIYHTYNNNKKHRRPKAPLITTEKKTFSMSSVFCLFPFVVFLNNVGRYTTNVHIVRFDEETMMIMMIRMMMVL